MGYQVLARKWRPKKFEEVVGQEHVIRTLQNAIKHKRLSHAYLFTGTRGVGKTSIARLFSKAIRCENSTEEFNPCLVCQSCKDIDHGHSLDFMEIDGASNNSVEDVRGLIENVQYLPSRGQYKIYVIDEVHMLSNSAFNALLKTLEEPPAHTIFILATTDPHKLLGTVVSRCQRYDFKHVSTEVIQRQIEKIASLEGIIFLHPNIPKKIAKLAKGSIRDSLSILDQVLGLAVDKKIREEDFSLAVGIIADSAMKNLLMAIFSGDVSGCSSQYYSFMQSNTDLRKFCDQILDSIYKIVSSVDLTSNDEIEEIIDKKMLSDFSLAEIIWIYETFAKDFNWALASLNPEQVVSIILQKVCLRRKILAPTDRQQVFNELNTEMTNQVTQKKSLNKSWIGFVEELRKENPTTASNIEHGNLVEEIFDSENILRITLGFSKEAEVFKDFLEKKEIRDKILKQLSFYFEREEKEIKFVIQVLSHEDQVEKNFKSKVEIDEEARLNEIEERKKKILNDPFVKEAEKIFKAKVDKIILNK